MSASAPEPKPSKLRGFLVAVFATIVAYAGTQQLILFMQWPDNFILFMVVFIAIDMAVMWAVERLLALLPKRAH